LPLRTPCSSDSDLQQSSEEGILSENTKNTLMSVKEEEAILATANALSGEDLPTSKRRGWPSKGGKASVPLKKATKEVVDLDGGSSLEGEGFAPTKWQDYEVKMLIAIQGRDGGRILIFLIFLL
jgi:hypothetical protein